MGKRGSSSGFGSGGPIAAAAPAAPAASSPAQQAPAAQQTQPQAQGTPDSLASAQTHAEIAAYMQAKHGIQVNTSALRNMSTDALRTACDGIEAVIDEFPGVARYIRTVTNGSRGRAIAKVNVRGDIQLNPKLWATQQAIDATAASNVRRKFHPQGTGAREFTSHEVGHLLNLMVINAAVRREDAARQARGQTPMTKMQRRFMSAADWNAHTTATSIVDRAVAAVTQKAQAAGHKPATRSQLRKNVSGYAMDNDSETVAECVADYIANRGKARRLSQEVWAILKQEIK